MDMTYDALRFWLEITVLISVVANTVYTFISNKQKANKTAINDMSKDINTLVRRVDGQANQLNNAPTHQDLSRMYERMNSVGNKLEKMSGVIEGMATQLSLINEHLINGGKR